MEGQGNDSTSYVNMLLYSIYLVKTFQNYKHYNYEIWIKIEKFFPWPDMLYRHFNTVNYVYINSIDIYSYIGTTTLFELLKKIFIILYWFQKKVFKMSLLYRSYFSTERAGIFAVLGDFDFLDHLTQRSAISGTIFTYDSYLLGTFGL